MILPVHVFANRNLFRSITVGLIALVPATTNAANRAYVANFFSNNLSVLDLNQRTEIARIPVGIGPADVAVAPDRSFAYVTNRDIDTISVVDTGMNIAVATIALQGCTEQAPCQPADVAFHPDGKRAYIAHAGPSGCTQQSCPAVVSVIDTSRHQVLATTEMSFEAAYGIAVAPDGRYAYVTGYRFFPTRYDVHIQAIDLRTNTPVPEVLDFGLARDIHVGLGQIPPPFLPRTDIVITPDGSRAYVSDGWSNSLTTMNLATMSRTLRYLGGEEAIDSLAITTGGESALVTRPSCIPLTLCATGGAILQTQTSGNDTPTSLPGNGPVGIAIDGSKAYVANLYDDAVSVLDLATNREIASIGTGGGPYRIALASFPECNGDCNDDDQVDVGDLVLLINVALGDAAVATCSSGDLDGDHRITVDEIVAAVDDALGGCGN